METKRIKNEGYKFPIFNVGDVVQLDISTNVVSVVWVGIFLAYKGKTSVAPQQVTHAIVGDVVRFYGNQHSKSKVDKTSWPIGDVILATEDNKKKYNEL